MSRTGSRTGIDTCYPGVGGIEGLRSHAPPSLCMSLTPGGSHLPRKGSQKISARWAKEKGRAGGLGRVLASVRYPLMSRLDPPIKADYDLLAAE